MSTVLALSSQVARGHVGLSAVVPALQALGHEVIALPTVLLSNHPGHPHVAGRRIEPDDLERMLDALGAGGWLGEVDAVLSGYLPTRAHVGVAARLIERLRRHAPNLLYLCDPVLGDDPKGLYLDEAAAEAIRSALLPLADCITPNRFELAWLAGRPVADPDQAVAAARGLGRPAVLATSVPAGEERLANLHVTPSHVLTADVPRRVAAPHGTGDLMSGLVLGRMLDGQTQERQLSLAVAGVEAAIAASEGRDELALAASWARWSAPQPAAVAIL